MILDAGFLISLDRGEDTARSFLAAAVRSQTPLHTTHPVVAQVWRDGARQARLAAFVQTLTVHSFDDGAPVGRLLALSGTSDVVDAHLVVLALRLGDDILTGDTDDVAAVTAPLGPTTPTIHPWS